jgi:hypothetical protein
MTQRLRLPDRRANEAYTFELDGHRYRASVSRFEDGSIAELFIDADKFGSGLQHHASTSAILASRLLQLGVPAEEISRSVGGVVAAALTHFARVAVL